MGETELGHERYENDVLPKICPFALYGLLFTITTLFALQGKGSPHSCWTSSVPPSRRNGRLGCCAAEAAFRGGRVGVSGWV
ncbi:hypothetical protein SSPO_079190 [Streptomyces antimycoticus]|uniref:Uncharacterized protein n=1 Tax=Streptomyces antimycoticus TaxID=68175 RepID=A0A499V6R3_9ACTN|nr:hypothetical protein SSPO_079190 [Streptomyces antimycoticus]